MKRDVQEKTKQIVEKTMSSLLTFELAMLEVDEELWSDENSSEDFMDIASDFQEAWHVDLLDWCADMMGVPRDNTVETRVCEIANMGQGWPRNAYCRDWIYNTWLEVIGGFRTIESLIEDMQEIPPDYEEKEDEEL